MQITILAKYDKQHKMPRLCGEEREAMIERGVRCEAAVHARSCVGYANSIDHLTPRAVAKLLGWRKKELNNPDNLVPMFRPCHVMKDKDTAKVKIQVRWQLRGKYIGLGEHI